VTSLTIGLLLLAQRPVNTVEAVHLERAQTGWTYEGSGWGQDGNSIRPYSQR